MAPFSASGFRNQPYIPFAFSQATWLQAPSGIVVMTGSLSPDMSTFTVRS